MIRLIVADDHPVVRMGIMASLAQACDMDIVGEARSSTELLALLARTGCDVLLTDYSMPDDRFGDGLQMLARLRRRHPRLAIVVLTLVSHPCTLRSISLLGCRGICDKRAPIGECVTAIRAVMEGGTFYSESAALALAGADDDDPRRTGTLSPREVEVVRLIAEGYSVEDIATRLRRSPKTVSSQKRVAMQRLGISTEDALMRYAYEEGLAWR